MASGLAKEKIEVAGHDFEVLRHAEKSKLGPGRSQK